MAGFSGLYVLGGQGGFMGADGVDRIGMLVLVGHSDRMWLEPHYFDDTLSRDSQVRVVVPKGPHDPDMLLDAMLAFAPSLFESCPTLHEVSEQLAGADRLDFDAGSDEIPKSWQQLREEARPIAADLNIWFAELKPLRG